MANFQNMPPASSPVTGNPDLDAYLKMQQQAQAAAATSSVPSGVAPDPYSTPAQPSESTPSFDINALMAPFQEKAEQLYGGNPVFGHSAFATNHPKLANILSSGLVAASNWRTGPTTGDNIGNAAQMALAPEELARQRAIEKAQYPAAMIGPQMAMMEKGAQINRDNAYADYMRGANSARAQGQANLSNAKTAVLPTQVQQGQQKINNTTVANSLAHEDRQAVVAQRAQEAIEINETRMAIANIQAQLKSNPNLQPKLEENFYKTLSTQIQGINARFDKISSTPIIDPTTGLARPRTQSEIDALNQERDEEIGAEERVGQHASKTLFKKDLVSMHPDLTRTRPNPQLPLPNGNGQTLDVFHAKAFVSAVGGDPNNPSHADIVKARALAKKYNWKF